MTKKKGIGTRAQIRSEKEKERRVAKGIFLVIILFAAAFSVYFAYPLLSASQNQISGTSSEPSPAAIKQSSPSSGLRAAIVDQVSLTSPNQAFVQTATETLDQANYSVDYYSSEEVTVDFYRNLPTHGYSMIILRVHSTATGIKGTQAEEVPVVLFTSEPYSSTKYVSEQLADQVFQVDFKAKSQSYFAVGPRFVASSMKGTFQNTLVIMMGCEGLTNTLMAEAFREKGAVAYISWSGSVSTSRTDQATTQLLQHLVTEGQTIREAAENTIKEVGPDPDYSSTLGYYPGALGDHTIQN
jgi:hypothetical protein